jgi:uncharacterized paraquat-inducible protein A
MSLRIWPVDKAGNPLPRDFPSSCANCNASVKLGALFEEDNGRRVCLKCKKVLGQKAQESRQTRLFEQQQGLFS